MADYLGFIPVINHSDYPTKIENFIKAVDTDMDNAQAAILANASESGANTTKLSGIEDNATRDQLGSEIKVLYEAEPDTNAFDDAAVAKLNGIAGDALTGAEIKALYEVEPKAYTDTKDVIIDGGTAATPTTLVDADRFVCNDDGSMIQIALSDLKTYILNVSHPVGSVYYSKESTSPATLFGGEWQPIRGRILMGEGDDTGYQINDTGGSKNAIIVQHGHVFTGTELPFHEHSLQVRAVAHSVGEDSPNSIGTEASISPSTIRTMNYPDQRANPARAGTPSGTVEEFGAPGTDENMPPYQCVYIWWRSA